MQDPYWATSSPERLSELTSPCSVLGEYHHILFVHWLADFHNQFSLDPFGNL